MWSRWIHWRPKRTSESLAGLRKGISMLKSVSKDCKRWLLLQMQSQQHKASRNMKNKRNMIPPREHNNLLVITPKDMKICYLLNKEFKITVLKLSTLQKETRQLNEIRKTMHEQNKFSKELEIEKENQWVRWKKCNRNHRHQNRSSRRICELEDRVFEVIQSETPQKKS